jgi:hypothetical protein
MDFSTAFSDISSNVLGTLLVAGLVLELPQFWYLEVKITSLTDV